MEFNDILDTKYFSIQSAIYPKTRETYYKLNTNDAVICLVVDDQDNFVMVQQDRPILGYRTIETPAGGIEEGETPDMAAQRELAEELSISCELYALPGKHKLMMNRTNNSYYLYMGFNPKRIMHKHNAENTLRLKIKRNELREIVKEGKVEQLAMLGLLTMVSTCCNVDIWSDDIDKIWKSATAQLRQV